MVDFRFKARGTCGNGDSMSGNRQQPDRRSGILPGSGRVSRGAFNRLLLLPLLVYLVWTAETYLFAGSLGLFGAPDAFAFLLYTTVTCILIGIVVPVMLVRRAFFTGDINMHQIGFRSLRRTLLMTSLTLLLVWAAVALQNPFGTDRFSFAVVFLQFLPTGIAMVMTCWVLAGTHVQAYVRNGGVLHSICTGVIVTGILSGLSFVALNPGVGIPGSLVLYFSFGILAAIFFFAVRDVWATSVAVTGGLVWLMAGRADTTTIVPVFPAISAAAVLTTGILAIIHWHLSRHYVTIPAPAA
ncbi:hypothetical protein [Methanoregula sp.]|uniref:hypothetical protein n=1 Tax=Methanoregula sp. TaxID=2052170 RepID=UPI00236EE467|nr:hypothetical protein [Methanoregula sp.]MDD1686508.1 hypothetical protein [Methanoregula sp.]